MSASRERKQRQDAPGDLTPKQRRDLNEARSAKQKKVAYRAIGIVAVILVAALLVWDSGILRGDPIAATVNGQEYKASQAAYYYGNIRQQEMQAASFYAQFGDQFGMPIYDSTKPDSQQIQNAETGETFADYFKTEALNSMKQVTLLCDQASSEGMTLSAEGQETVKSNIKSVKTYAAQNGMTYSAYIKVMFSKLLDVKTYESELAREVLAGEYQTAKQESFTYDESQLDTYYNEHQNTMDTYEYSYAQIDGKPATKTGDDGTVIEPTEAESAAAMSEAKLKAEAMAAELNDGAEFNVTAQKYVSETEAESYRSDPEYRHKAGDLGSILSGYSYGDWLISTETPRRAGDIGVVEDQANGCYYVVQLLDRHLDKETLGTVSARHILVKAELSEGATEPTEEQYAAAQAKIETLKTQWESGDKTSESFGKLATDNSEDPGSKDNGGLYEDVTSGTMFAGFNDFLFAPGRSVGDVGIVQNTQSGQQGYHLIYIESLGAPAWEHTATTALRAADYTEWYDGMVVGYEATAVDKGMSLVVK